MNNYCIYMHRNTKNGKLYFGQTCQIVEQRWKNGKGYDKCPNFWNAIIAEGWNNFEHIVLDTELSKEQADEKEKFYIQTFHTTNPQFGYNMKLGQKEKCEIQYQNHCNNYTFHCDIDEIIRSEKQTYLISNTNDIFRSREDAAKWVGLANGTTITKNSNNDPKYKTAGSHPITLERLMWSKISKEQIMEIVNESV